MANKTFNFNANLLDLAGNPFLNPENSEPVTLGSQLAPAIAQHTKGDALKLFGWAMSIYKKEDLFLDVSDQNMLIEFITSSSMNVLVKAQLLAILN